MNQDSIRARAEDIQSSLAYHEEEVYGLKERLWALQQICSHPKLTQKYLLVNGVRDWIDACYDCGAVMTRKPCFKVGS